MKVSKFKRILRALKVVLLSMAHMDYQMEFEKRKKKAKTKRRRVTAQP